MYLCITFNSTSNYWLILTFFNNPFPNYYPLLVGNSKVTYLKHGERAGSGNSGTGSILHRQPPLQTVVESNIEQIIFYMKTMYFMVLHYISYIRNSCKNGIKISYYNWLVDWCCYTIANQWHGFVSLLGRQYNLWYYWYMVHLLYTLHTLNGNPACNTSWQSFIF